MKIGIVLYPTFGGSGVVATELGKALAEKGHEIHFITYSQPVRLGSFRQNIFYHEVAVSDYPLFDYQPYETELASKMVDVVKYEKLDLLHVHYAIPHASAAYMAKQILKAENIHIPYITTLHGTDITLVGKDPSFEPVITFCLNQSDAITAVSQSLKEDTLSHFAVKKPIHVIPNFIQISEPTRRKKRDEMRMNYAKSGEKILCHVSNFRKVKRVEDVLLVFEKVQQKIPAILLFVGDGPERYKVERLCREMDLCEKVFFVGKVKDTSQVLSISDLFLLPSETESFGLAALEAMAVEVPVISSNTGGIPEVNVSGVSGYLSAVGDIKDMSDKALQILGDEKNQATFRAGALQVARQFTLEKILPSYEALYKETLEKHQMEVASNAVKL